MAGQRIDAGAFLLDMVLEREGGTFANLAKQAGLSARDCALAARTGRLGDVIRVAQQRRGQARSQPYGTLSGAMALARVRELEHRG
jgi:hypothetical protein